MKSGGGHIVKRKCEENNIMKNNSICVDALLARIVILIFYQLTTAFCFWFLVRK